MCDTCGCQHHDHDHLHISLPVSGMMCELCAAAVEKSLNSLHGVHAKADFQSGMVELSLHDDAVPLDEIKSAICALGYQA